MDELGGRLERLTPEQRRSVEDYIDFLLSRTSGQAGMPGAVSPAMPSAAATPPPILSLPEQHRTDLPQQAPVIVALPQEPEKPAVAPSPQKTAGECAGFQEVMAEKDDTFAPGYMDYGAFEAPKKPSPADEAVRRVKIKMDGKKEKDPARNVLEWIE